MKDIELEYDREKTYSNLVVAVKKVYADIKECLYDLFFTYLQRFNIFLERTYSTNISESLITGEDPNVSGGSEEDGFDAIPIYDQYHSEEQLAAGTSFDCLSLNILLDETILIGHWNAELKTSRRLISSTPFSKVNKFVTTRDMLSLKDGERLNVDIVNTKVSNLFVNDNSPFLGSHC